MFEAKPIPSKYAVSSESDEFTCEGAAIKELSEFLSQPPNFHPERGI
jgi:hypothetical protein